MFLKINCYFTDITFLIFIASKQQDRLSHPIISMLNDNNPVERYRLIMETQRINWDSFQFKIKVVDEIKVNMINLFNFISNLGLNSSCLKYLKDESVCCGRSSLWLCKSKIEEYLIASLQCMPIVSRNIKKHHSYCL